MKAIDSDHRVTVLFEEHFDEIVAYCARRIGSTDAEDVAIDVFAVAWRRVDDIDWDTARAWLYGIARGVVSNRLRSRQRQGRLLVRLAGRRQPTPTTPEAKVVRRSEDQDVIDAVRQLRPADQEVLMLSAWEELTAAEIAAVLDISTSAAEQRLHRAKGRLAKVLKPREVGEPLSDGKGVPDVD